MLVRFEKRVRVGGGEFIRGEFYKVVTYSLFGLIPLYRTYTQLTTSADLAVPSEL